MRGSRPAAACEQRGASLLIALIALLMLTLMGLALVRSVDTSHLIAGNFALRQAAVNGADIGSEAALNFVRNTVLACANAESPNQRYPANCSLTAGNCQYYPSVREEDKGLVLASAPGAATKVAVNWSGIAAVDEDATYRTRFVIDRLCEQDNPAGDILTLCRTGEPVPTDSLSSKPLPSFACDREFSVFYRVTVRTEGPKDTVSMVQTLIAAK
jgi:Tfp pilus assembly protein PilX